MPTHTGTAHADIAMPVQGVYELWTRVETYPHYLSAVEEVARLTDTVLHWRVAFGEHRRDFDAVVEEHLPRQRIAWRSLGSAFHTGNVTFEALDAARTRVRLHLTWDHRVLESPEGEQVSGRLVDDAAVAADLRAFADYAAATGAGDDPPRLIGEPEAHESPPGDRLG